MATMKKSERRRRYPFTNFKEMSIYQFFRRLFKKERGRKKIICFDLEGPLSPTDLGFELMKLIPYGDRIFPVISRYDDLLTLEGGKEGYEPGGTLSLIIPFLIRGGIRERDIKKVSAEAPLIEGAKELVRTLKKEGWKIYVNSTSYREYTLNIAKRLGIRKENSFSTQFPLDRFQKDLKGESLSWIKMAETHIANFLFSENLSSGEKDKEIRDYLDPLYWPLVGKIGEIINEVKVNGGERKVRVLRVIAQREKVKLGEIKVVGDSITDFKMLKAVKEARGLAIAFNANQYALPYATFGVASPNLRDIKPVLDTWEKKERVGRLKNLAKQKGPPYYQWIGNKDLARLKEDLKHHQECREIVRGKATAKLG